MYLIYKITNKVNNKLYVGITSRSLRVRFREHVSKTYKSAISNAVRKYGKINFIIEQIDQASNLEDALKKETFYIKELNSNVINGNGYNIIGDTIGSEYTFSMKLSYVESMKTKKLNSSKYMTDYIGVHYLKECKKWSYSFTFDDIKISMKKFDSDHDAAVGRDLKLLEIFDTASAIRMMNFPENIEGYLNNEIKLPRRTLKRSLKISKLNHVQYEKGYNQWRTRIRFNNTTYKFGLFRTEQDAAEYADFFNITVLSNYNTINYPENIKNITISSYTPPKTAIELLKKCPHKNISPEKKKGELIGYRIYIQTKDVIIRPYFKTLEEAIQKRNEILLQLGRPIPD